MIDEPFALRFVPPPTQAKLESAVASLRGTRPSVSSGEAVVVPGAAPAEGFRFALALRGRWNPAELLPQDLGVEQRLAVLDQVALDCDIETREGRPSWLLKDAVRRRVLRSHPAEEVAHALRGVTPADAITSSLQSLYVGPPLDVATLSQPELRQLAVVTELTAGHAPPSLQPDLGNVCRHASRKARDDDYARTLRRGCYGRETELAQILEFLERQPTPGLPSCEVHLFGSGGVGKSTVVAEVARRWLERHPDGVLVHLDFDRSDLNPQRPASLDLEVLTQIGVSVPALDAELEPFRERIRLQMGDELSNVDADAKMRQAFTLESAEAFSGGILPEALGSLYNRWPAGAFLLILDTLEQLDAGGPTYAVALANWMRRLASSTNHPRLCHLRSGRTMPDEVVTTPSDLRVPLGELKEDGALALLEARGILDPAAAAVVKAFGGNPLLLHLVGDLAQTSPTAIDELTREARAGRLPPEIVQGILYDRFLKHIGDDNDTQNAEASRKSRQYAHPGLVLPELTVDLIQRAVAPVFDEAITNEQATAIYAVLERATWLVTPSREDRGLTPRRDLRVLLLKLLKSDAARAADISRLREYAIQYHAGETGDRHRALVLYHELMQAQSRRDLDRFADRDLTGLVEHIRQFADDFSDDVRAFLQSVGSGDVGPERAINSLSDTAWANYLGGTNNRSGLGDQLVNEDPVLSLSLWRRRPFGTPATPPTFVLEAMAATAEWDLSGLDVHGMASELSTRHDFERRADMRRTTALARLCLLAGEQEALPELADLMRETLDEAKGSLPGVPELCAVASVWECLKNVPQPIVPARFLTGREALTSETRLYFATSRLKADFQWRPHLDALAVTQTDWADRVLGLGIKLEASVLRSAQKRLDALDGEPLDAVNVALEKLRKRVTFGLGREVRTGPTRDRARVLLLRGTTPEFYRPARQALCEALTDETSIKAFSDRFRESMTICPRDLEPQTFVKRAVREPARWFLALVNYADRSRVLGSALECARDVAPEAAKLRLVRDRWHAWDQAIGRGHPSDWLMAEEAEADA